MFSKLTARSLMVALAAILASPSSAFATLISGSYQCFDTSNSGSSFEATYSGTCTAGSPWAADAIAGNFSSFYLENMEDATFVTGWSADNGARWLGGITDSVDSDDGNVDGSGLLGDSWFYGGGSTGITFTFDSGALGGLPTYAAIVWTDSGGGASITFEAFDQYGDSLGTLGGIGDLSNNGETAEDLFFGAIDLGGISSIFISNAHGGIEVDHLQFGFMEGGGSSLPEPGMLGLFGLGLLGLGAARRRRRPVI